MARLLLVLLGLLPAPARLCEVALVFALDVSNSVDDAEHRLQTDGLPPALRDPAIADAPLSGEAAFAVRRWSGEGRQRVSPPWRRLTGPEELDRFAAAVRGLRRAVVGSGTRRPGRCGAPWRSSTRRRLAPAARLTAARQHPIEKAQDRERAAVTATTDAAAPPPTLADLARVFLRIGFLSFGGPAAQIALMHRELVEERPWLSEAQFLRALSFCMLLPGPEAMQLATFAGWRLHGVVGGLVAGGLFVLPGAAVIFALALAYGALIDEPLVQALFLGVKATVVVIVVEAILRVGRRALKRGSHWAVAALAFVALYALAVPFPIVVLAAGLGGALAGGAGLRERRPPPFDLRHLAVVVLAGLSLWWAPVLWAALAEQDLLTEIGLFFSKLAVVTFGGAYAVLSYLAQEVVAVRGWVTTGQLMDALGLAETTPGPLILVTTFVAILAGLNEGGVALGVAGGLMALWVTFVPCFLWIFAGAPLVDWIEGQPRLRAALAAITAAVVGVIANLSLWFALHVAFGRVSTIEAGPLSAAWPVWSSWQPLPVALALVAAWLILWRHQGLLATLALVAGLAGLLHPLGAT